jgi:WD40 repeat protein
VLGLAFHPGGRRVATASLDGTVRLWGPAAGKDATHVLDFRHLGPACAVAFAPSGRHLAVGLSNGKIALFATPAPVER